MSVKIEVSKLVLLSCTALPAEKVSNASRYPAARLYHQSGLWRFASCPHFGSCYRSAIANDLKHRAAVSCLTFGRVKMGSTQHLSPFHMLPGRPKLSLDLRTNVQT